MRVAIASPLRVLRKLRHSIIGKYPVVKRRVGLIGGADVAAGEAAAPAKCLIVAATSVVSVSLEVHVPTIRHVVIWRVAGVINLAAACGVPPMLLEELGHRDPVRTVALLTKSVDEVVNSGGLRRPTACEPAVTPASDQEAKHNLQQWCCDRTVMC